MFTFKPKALKVWEKNLEVWEVGGAAPTELDIDISFETTNRTLLQSSFFPLNYILQTLRYYGAQNLLYPTYTMNSELLKELTVHYCKLYYKQSAPMELCFIRYTLYYKHHAPTELKI